jgi:hypothetical protein
MTAEASSIIDLLGGKRFCHVVTHGLRPKAMINTTSASKLQESFTGQKVRIILHAIPPKQHMIKKSSNLSIH